MPPYLGDIFAGRKIQLWTLGIVAVLALLAANTAWLLPTLTELRDGAYVLHKTIALDVKNQISAFLNKHEETLKNAADVINQQETETNKIISRIMKETQPFESVALLDLAGKERLKNHRFLLITSQDLKDRSADPLFKAVQSGQIYRSPVLISGISEPIITIAVPLREGTGLAALVAEVNLKFLLEVVRGISVGERGAAYVVDQDGYIIAHPNSSLVFGRVNVLRRGIVKRALEGQEADTRESELAYRSESGEEVLATALPLELTNWAAIVENPRSKALASSRRIIGVATVSLSLEILLLVLLIWNYFKLVKTANLFYSERNQREAILNSLYDGVIEYDEKSRIVLMNPKAEELLGIKFVDIVGLIITPELAKEKPRLRGIVELMYPALASYASATKVLPGSSAKTMEVHVSNPELRLMVTLTQVVDQEGSVRGFLKILRDISREQLISRIKSEFVSIAAHQLRTPLSAIKWTLKLLIDGDAGEMTASQQEFLQKGYVINERMIKLVNDLLNAARIEEGRFGYEFKDVNLNELLEGVFVSFAPLANARKIDFRFDKTDNLPSLYADPEKLSLALSNLLENATKYTPEGGKVVLKAQRRGGFVEIAISDNGVGIPQPEQKRVFSKFFRASNVIKMETEGTGLGLFIVRNIIKRHGGDIRFDSKEKEGTTFLFTLPVARELIPKEETPVLEEFLEKV